MSSCALFAAYFGADYCEKLLKRSILLCTVTKFCDHYLGSVRATRSDDTLWSFLGVYLLQQVLSSSCGVLGGKSFPAVRDALG